MSFYINEFKTHLQNLADKAKQDYTEPEGSVNPTETLSETYSKVYRSVINEQPSIGSNQPQIGYSPAPPTIGGPNPTLGVARVPTGLSEPDNGTGIPPLPFAGNWPQSIIDGFNAALEAFGATIGQDIWALAAGNPNFPWNLVTGTVCGMGGCEDNVQLFYGGPTEWNFVYEDMMFVMVWDGTTWTGL